MKAAIWSGTAGVVMHLLASSGPAFAGEEFMLASGRSGAPAFAAGVGLSSLIKFKLLPTERIDLQTLASAGAVDNARLLQTGEADFAILPSAIGHAARLGIGSFADDPPATGLRAIATLWRDALHLVVREDDVVTGTIDDLSKLKDRKLFLGEAATGMIDVNRLLLEDLGMDPDRSFQPTTIADGDGIAAIKRGEVDAFSVTARPPETTFEAVFEEATSGLRLLDVTETQMTRANGNHWLWTPYIIPAATYPGQKEDVWTIALSNLLVVRADVDPDVVHAVTRSIFENLAYLKRVDPVMTDLSLETALAGMAMPLHPGALRYYKEAGLVPGSNTDEDAVSPEVLPVRQDDSEQNMPKERYPDADVAGDWPNGVGGPLQRTNPNGAEAGAPNVPEPAANRRPEEIQKEPEPHWRQRATL